jgi:broad specificity phosphatase PhoE
MTVHRLLLARHGQTSYNSQRRFTGWHDPPLTRRGRAEARALGTVLRRQEIDAVYSSDLQRTVETARIALDGRDGLKPVTDPALREANFGEWQGLTFDDARARNPLQFESLLDRSSDFCAPLGETIPAVHGRVLAFLGRVHDRHDGQTLLVVASGGPLQILVAHLFSMPVAAHWRLGMTNCSLSIVDFARGEALLTLLNGRSHLSRLRRADRRRAAQAAGG